MIGKGKTRAEFLIAFGLFLSVFLVYNSIPTFEFNNYDDLHYIVENPVVQKGLTLSNIYWAFTSFSVSNWHPVTWLSHMLDCSLFGMNPGGHYWTNLLLHSLNSILLFIILLKMTGGPWRSAFVAVLFAVHPLHVESVVWVSERKDLLSAFFAFLTIWAYWSYTVNSGRKFYWTSVSLFAAGLMSKPMLVTLPFVLVLLDYWPLGRLRQRISMALLWAQLREKMPFLVLSLISSAMTISAQQNAMYSMQEFPLEARLGNAVLSYFRYLGKTFWPDDLAFFYPFPGFMETGAVVICAAALIGLTLVAFRLARIAPYFPVGWLWYLGTLVPVIGIVQVGSQSMADRYTYIPLVGIFIILVWGTEAVSGYFKHVKVAAFALGCALSLALAVNANVQASHWKNSKAIYTHALNVIPGNYVAHNNLGVAFIKERDFSSAEINFREAVKIHPDYSQAIYNLAVLYELQNRLDESISAYKRFLRTEKGVDPVLRANGRIKLAMALLKKGQMEEAESEIKEAVSSQPDNAAARNSYGVILAHQKRITAAREQFEKALILDPGNMNYAGNLQKIIKGDSSVQK